MQVVSLLLRRFLFFYRDAVGIGISIVANASYLPGNPSARFTTRDLEPVTRTSRAM
jgi:hypothetical protein